MAGFPLSYLALVVRWLVRLAARAQRSVWRAAKEERTATEVSRVPHFSAFPPAFSRRHTALVQDSAAANTLLRLLGEAGQAALDGLDVGPNDHARVFTG